MIVQPLIFGSTDRGTVKGYQLLSRCTGVDDQMAQAFCRWAPSHGSLRDSQIDAESINYFSIDEDLVAVTRSMHGGPEYSGRGGMQVVTIGLLVSRHQMAAYDYDAFAIADTAITLGHMILPSAITPLQKSILLPRRPLARRQESSHQLVTTESTQIASKLQSGQRLMVVGDCDPTQVARQVIRELPADQRSAITFSTGLKLSSRRDFQLQFLPEMDHTTELQLERQKIATIPLQSSVFA